MEDHATATLRSHTLQKQAFAPAHQSLQLDSTSVKKSLGNIFEEAALHYLSGLFKGNGWTVALTDAGYSNTLLLSDPKHPDTILLIVKFIRQEHELTYQEARDELIDFENNLSPKYQCSQFAIIALNGVSAQAESLERFNLLLQDWEYIDELIKNYSTTKIQEPRIQLFAHNKQTYKKVQRMMKRCTSIAVVQATGTGKSFLIAKLLQDFTGKKRLVMAPSMYVIDQVKEHIRWDAGNIEYMTYARSMNLSQSDIAALSPKMIVLDEFHRCGAEEWGRGVQNILNAYPQAFKLGTSATPVRYMDNARDMSAELFNNNVAENLSLAQAIVRNILPMPKYVCALYTLTEERDILRDKISRSRSTEALKKRMQLDLDTATIDWERSHGIPSILKKYLQPHMKKFIIFCKDEQHLLEMEPIVSAWFSAATGITDVKTYRICDGEPKSLDNLKAFKSADAKAAIHLLFSINMLNEGLHVNEVSGVVLLRPTESPNIFYQQIGRCLKVGLSYSPVIFDLVNNFRSIRTMDFLYDLEFAHSQYASDRVNENLHDRCPVFTVMDEVREITEIFGEIKFRLDDWEGMFQRLVEYKELFGHCNVTASKNDEVYRNLWNWLCKQRNKCKRGILEPARQNKLEALGFDWKLDQLTGRRDELWEKMFQKLVKYKELFGHCNVSAVDTKYVPLQKWVREQRSMIITKMLEPERCNRLLALGVDVAIHKPKGWESEVWEKRFNTLNTFRLKYGHFKVAKHNDNEFPRLARFVLAQRSAARHGILSEQRRQKLISIGFEFESNFLEGGWQARFDELVAYKNKHGHFRLSEKSIMYLFFWIQTQRALYRNNKLDELRKQKLISIGFTWNQSVTKLFEENFTNLVKHYQKNEHFNFPHLSKLYNFSNKIRRLYAKGILPVDVNQELLTMNFDFSFKEGNNAIREKNLRQYEQFFKLNGNGHVTRKNEPCKGLSNWLILQRINYKNNNLPPTMIQRMEAAGIDWQPIKNANDRNWNSRYQELLQLKKKTGNITPPYKNMVLLLSWCSKQRQAYNENTLTSERIAKLSAIGFLWEVFESKWEQKFASLVAFQSLNGHCLVSANNPATKSLGLWCGRERSLYKKGKLSKEKIRRLEDLGFTWNVAEEIWHSSYEKIKKYMAVNTVEEINGRKFKYYSWVSHQRRHYRNNNLSQDKIMLLNMLGMKW